MHFILELLFVRMFYCSESRKPPVKALFYVEEGECFPHKMGLGVLSRAGGVRKVLLGTLWGVTVEAHGNMSQLGSFCPLCIPCT